MYFAGFYSAGTVTIETLNSMQCHHSEPGDSLLLLVNAWRDLRKQHEVEVDSVEKVTLLQPAEQDKSSIFVTILGYRFPLQDFDDYLTK
jgi:hypothetical protein